MNWLDKPDSEGLWHVHFPAYSNLVSVALVRVYNRERYGMLAYFPGDPEPHNVYDLVGRKWQKYVPPPYHPEPRQLQFVITTQEVGGT